MVRRNRTNRTEEIDTIVVGAGLAGLACAFELADQGQQVVVLEARDVPGGRTANWRESRINRGGITTRPEASDTGMKVESGFHKFIGYYEELPKLLKRAGIDLDRMVTWEKTFEIRIADEEKTGEFGVAPAKAPLKTLAGLLGNNDILSYPEKLSLLPFFAAGIKDYLKNPEELDQYSVKEYADKHSVHPDAIRHLLGPLTGGIFFLPPERFSALPFFSFLAPGAGKLLKMQIGGFNGGMTDVMIAPLIAAIEARGGEVRLSSPVQEMIYIDGRVRGVRLEGGGELAAANVVVAADAGAAQRLLRPQFGTYPGWEAFFALQTMPHVTLQAELTRPFVPEDRTVFGPGTVFGSFTEQSRTTFKHAQGRLSVIMTPSDVLVSVPDEQIFEQACRDAERLGLELRSLVTDYRVIRGKDLFYSVRPGNARNRPEQRTRIPGLTLAGDYTRQAMFTTMEGAVRSGLQAAGVVTQSYAAR